MEIAGKRDDWLVSGIGRIPDYTSQFVYKIRLSPNLTQLITPQLFYSECLCEIQRESLCEIQTKSYRGQCPVTRKHTGLVPFITLAL